MSQLKTKLLVIVVVVPEYVKSKSFNCKLYIKVFIFPIWVPISTSIWGFVLLLYKKLQHKLLVWKVVVSPYPISGAYV